LRFSSPQAAQLREDPPRSADKPQVCSKGKLSIKTSQVVRRALEQEVKKQELRKIQAMIEELQPVLAKISIQEVVKSIRQDREQT
jgi:hypothetical protein